MSNETGNYTQGYSGGTGGASNKGGVLPKVGSIQVGYGSYIDGVVLLSPDTGGPSITLTGSKFDAGNTPKHTLAGDEYITSISGGYGSYINTLTIKTNKNSYNFPGTAAGSFNFSYEAPVGFCIVGLWGRTGGSVDAIGVMFGVIPAN